jgi:hypothetical protein
MYKLCSFSFCFSKYQFLSLSLSLSLLFVILEFELRTLYLPSKWPTTWDIPPYLCSSLFSGKVLHSDRGQRVASDRDPPTSASPSHGIKGLHHLTSSFQIAFWKLFFPLFWIALNHNHPLSSSFVSLIMGMYHHTWPFKVQIS